jgi:hypothetical protein
MRDFVDFPVDGLDLSRIMVEDSVGNSGKGHADSKKSQSEQNGNIDDDKDDAADDNDERQSDSTDHDTEMNGDDNSVHGPDGPKVSKRESKMNNDDGRGEMLYDLYAVVHHQGAMGGGHYVASLKSEIDGQWRLFNDAQIFEIHSTDVVDSSAYILFYIRRDVASQKLSDFWDIRKREGEGMTEEEMDNLIKKSSDRCVIS